MTDRQKRILLELINSELGCIILELNSDNPMKPYSYLRREKDDLEELKLMIKEL